MRKIKNMNRITLSILLCTLYSCQLFSAAAAGEKEKIDKNEINESLFAACCVAHVAKVKIALDGEADVNYKSQGSNGLHALLSSSLHVWSDSGKRFVRYADHKQQWGDFLAEPTRMITQMLIDKNIDVNAIDTLGRTALHYAAWGDQTDVVFLLLKAGADSTLKDTSKSTAEQVARELGYHDTANLIVDFNTI